MNPRFVNSFDITEDVYMDWSKHPIGPVAKKNAKMMLILFFAELAVSVGVAVYGLGAGNMLYVIVGCVAAGYITLKQFLLDGLKHRRDFRRVLRSKPGGVWRRVTRFGDGAPEVEDAGKTTSLDYAEFADATENGEWYCLWLNPSSAYHVKRDAFTEGDAADFLPFMKERIAEARKRKAEAAAVAAESEGNEPGDEPDVEPGNGSDGPSGDKE